MISATAKYIWDRRFPFVLLGLGLSAAVAWFFGPWLVRRWARVSAPEVWSVEQLGQFGDQFGAITALISCLTFLAVLYTVWQQQVELRHQREEMEAQRRAAEDSAKALLLQVEDGRRFASEAQARADAESEQQRRARAEQAVLELLRRLEAAGGHFGALKKGYEPLESALIQAFQRKVQGTNSPKEIPQLLLDAFETDGGRRVSFQCEMWWMAVDLLAQRPTMDPYLFLLKRLFPDREAMILVIYTKTRSNLVLTNGERRGEVVKRLQLFEYVKVESPFNLQHIPEFEKMLRKLSVSSSVR